MSRKNSPLYLNVYAVNQCYGGPEEGGWWYYAGQALATIKLKRSEKINLPKRKIVIDGAVRRGGYPVYVKDANARHGSRVLRKHKPITLCIGHRSVCKDAVLAFWKNQAITDFSQYHDADHPLSSVASGGKVDVYVGQNPAQDFPQERPHYE